MHKWISYGKAKAAKRSLVDFKANYLTFLLGFQLDWTSNIVKRDLFIFLKYIPQDFSKLPQTGCVGNEFMFLKFHQ